VIYEPTDWIVSYYDENEMVIDTYIIRNRTEHEAESEVLGDLEHNYSVYDWTLVKKGEENV
jgi:hypothetical protein